MGTGARPGTSGASRLRVLYITNSFPYPLTSGLLRHYFLVKELSEAHDVTLLSIVDPRLTRESRDALAPFTERILTFPRVGRDAPFHRRVLARLRPFLPRSHAGTPAGRLGAAAAGLIAGGHADVALFSGKGTYPALEAIRRIPVVVDLCDTSSTRIRRHFRFAPRRQVPKLALEYAEMLRVERLLARKASHLLFASARDRDALLDRHPELRDGAPVTVLPNGVDLDYWRRTGNALGTDEIVFTGAMDWPPNEDAALHLVRDVMPLIWRSRPDARVSVVGRSPGPALRGTAVDARVTVTGYVPDVRPYLERAAVFAAPLRFGAGIQNKLLEAMAMEVPSVVSALAAAGVRTEDGRDPPVAIASEPRELAVRILELLEAVETSSAPDAAARCYVETHFTWRRCGELLRQALESAIVATRATAEKR